MLRVIVNKTPKDKNLLFCSRILAFFIFWTASAAAANIPIYGVFEWPLMASSNYTFTTAPVVTVTFTGISGEAKGAIMTVRGFWDGGKNFKVRFSPRFTGTWQYMIYSTDPGLDGKSGSFVCAGALPSEHASYHGHVVTNCTYPYTLMYYDGTPFFLMGDTQWSFSTDEISWPNEFKTYIDARSDQGFNYIHGVVYQTWPIGNDKNEGGQAFIGNNAENLNPRFWQAFDQRVEYMNQKGIVVGFMLAWASDGWNKFNTESQVKRYAQYVIDRYSTYNLIWITEGEYEESNLPGGHNKLGNYFKDNDPYNHPITIHTVNTSADDFGHKAWHTVIYQQTGAPGKITADRIYNKPVINSEFGYEGDQTADELRKDEWEIVVRGGFFVYGNTGTYHYNASMTEENLNSSGTLYSTILYNFFTQKTRWSEMKPDNSLVSIGFCLANLGQEYVIYLPKGGSIMVNLAAASGDLSAEWFNPRTGLTTAAGIVTGGENSNFTAPDSNDWVLHIFLPISLSKTF